MKRENHPQLTPCIKPFTVILSNPASVEGGTA